MSAAVRPVAAAALPGLRGAGEGVEPVADVAGVDPQALARLGRGVPLFVDQLDRRELELPGKLPSLRHSGLLLLFVDNHYVVRPARQPFVPKPIAFHRCSSVFICGSFLFFVR